MTTCLFFLGGIIGTWCMNDAPPVGICHPVGDDLIYCTVDMEELPIRASWYNPELGGINCDSDCSQLGDGTPTADGYGRYAACPAGMYGMNLDVQFAGQWQCRDHGGMVTPHYGRVFDGSKFVDTWYITVDFLLHDPAPWSYMLLDWSVVQ